MSVRLLPHLPIAVVLLLAAAPARAEELCTPTDASKLPATLRMKDFGELLVTRIDACATDARRADGERFWRTHALDATDGRLRDYVRARTLFELTRDGGPWRVRWAITNQEPSAKKIWETWQAHPPAATSTAASVTAECDEISALFAGLARRSGVRGVGLLWPTKNHTIAAWDAAPGVRILVPTTQIYAACEDTFDRAPFSPTVQKTVFEFPASDTPDATPLPQALAIFLLDQVTRYAGASLDLLAAIRIHRALGLGSSVKTECRENVVAAAAKLRGETLAAADRRALGAYGRERGLPSVTPLDVLDHLARVP